MNIAVIIPAAGASRRFQDDNPLGPLTGRSKLDESLGGRPVLQRTIEIFTKHPDVALTVVAGPADDEAWSEFSLRHADKVGLLGARLCRGGKTHRYETVRNALEVVKEHASDAGVTHVAVHDAARPCASFELIERLFSAAQAHEAVIPAVEVGDTLKRIGDEAIESGPVDAIDNILGGAGKGSEARPVVETVDRTNLVAVQTPQVFTLDVITRAYDQDNLESTDDAQLVERLGVTVATVKGDVRNIKITRPADVELARNILGLREDKGRATHMKF